MADRRHVTNSGLLEDLVPHRTEAEARAGVKPRVKITVKGDMETVMAAVKKAIEESQ